MRAALDLELSYWELIFITAVLTLAYSYLRRTLPDYIAHLRLSNFRPHLCSSQYRYPLYLISLTYGNETQRNGTIARRQSREQTSKERRNVPNIQHKVAHNQADPCAPHPILSPAQLTIYSPGSRRTRQKPSRRLPRRPARRKPLRVALHPTRAARHPVRGRHLPRAHNPPTTLPPPPA